MKHVLDTTGTADGLSKAIDACLTSYAPAGLMILAGNDNGFSPESIDSILRDVPVPIFGGTFPGVLCGRQLLTRGTVVIALPSTPRIKIVHGLHDTDREFDDQLDVDLLGDNGRTMFVFVDGLAMRVDALLSALFCEYGLEINYVGGGAGALQLESIPCLITNDGLIRDAAILAVVDNVSSVGISHGMTAVSGPHMVSDVQGNRIGFIDWEPAVDRFRELIGTVEPALANASGFPISDEFCLAINRIGGEKVVRDPFKTDPDGSLYVVSELSEGSFVDLVRATPESIIGAAGRALMRAQEGLPDAQAETGLFCFDCFTRWQFLGERFDEEITALQDDQHTLLGVLTLGGEVANCGQEFLDYYNRTCVVAMMEERCAGSE